MEQLKPATAPLSLFKGADKLEQLNKRKIQNRALESTKPIYLRKLVEAMDKAKHVAKLLKCSPTTISRSLLEDNATFTYEELARYIWMEKYEPKPVEIVYQDRPRTHQLVLVHIPNESFTALEGVVNGWAGKIYGLPE